MGAVAYQKIAGLTANSAIKDYTCLQWVMHVRLSLENMCNNKQQVYCTQ